MDEMSLWGTELTAAQVKELYEGKVWTCNLLGGAPTAGPGDLTKHSQYSNLISWWRFCDGTGDTISDNQTLITTAKDQKGSNDAIFGNGDFYNLTPSMVKPACTSGPPGASAVCIVTGSVFDNAYISHMIPRTEFQTRWITASII
jgi:hypothetical protein